MGVFGLFQLLQPIAKPLPISSLKGKILAVDASIWIVQFLAATRKIDERKNQLLPIETDNDYLVSLITNSKYLSLFLLRICKLLYHGISPVFVFDGKIPHFKIDTLIQRKQQRLAQAALKRERKVKKMLLEYAKSVIERDSLSTPVDLDTMSEGQFMDNQETSIPNENLDDLSGFSLKVENQSSQEIDDNSINSEPEQYFADEACVSAILANPMNALELIKFLNPIEQYLTVLKASKDFSNQNINSFESSTSLSFSHNQIARLRKHQFLKSTVSKLKNQLSNNLITQNEKWKIGNRNVFVDSDLFASDNSKQFLFVDYNHKFSGNHNQFLESSESFDRKVLHRWENPQSIGSDPVIMKTMTSLAKTIPKSDNSLLIPHAEDIPISLKSILSPFSNQQTTQTVPIQTLPFDESIKLIPPNPQFPHVNDSVSIHQLEQNDSDEEFEKDIHSAENVVILEEEEEEEDQKDDVQVLQQSHSNNTKPTVRHSDRSPLSQSVSPPPAPLWYVNSSSFNTSKTLPNIVVHENPFLQDHSNVSHSHLNESVKLNSTAITLKNQPKIKKSTQHNLKSQDSVLLEREKQKSPKTIIPVNQPLQPDNSRFYEMVESDEDDNEPGFRSDENESQVLKEITALLEIINIPYIFAPFEAEAQCARLEMDGIVDGIITEDSDVFLFGGKNVYRKVFSQNPYCQLYSLPIATKHLGIDRNVCIQLAFLVGSDYTNRINGIGMTNALEILSLVSLEQLAAILDSSFTSSKSTDVIQDLPQSTIDTIRKRYQKKIILPNSFPNPSIRAAYESSQTLEIKPKTVKKWWKRVVDLNQVYNFCWVKFGWDRQTSEYLVGKSLNKVHTDSILDFYFDPTVSESDIWKTITSKRMKAALKQLAKRQIGVFDVK